jgi:hypothetical protein
VGIENLQTGALCTGTLVAPDWVLTARHCLQINPALIAIPGTRANPSPTFLPAVRSVAHPFRDLALLALDLTDAGAEVSGVVPMRPAAETTDRLTLGDRVEIAGYGLTETGETNGLRFLVEPISAIIYAEFTVDGLGAAGACQGDSGGPLLLREQDGAVAVAGVLTGGSVSCVERDVYTRVDDVSDWVLQTIGGLTPLNRECGTISEEGRCLYGDALWCRNGELVVESCSNGTRCGWNERTAAVGCVEPSGDPCQGVDSFGACRDNTAAFCNRGVLEEERCVACNGCRIDGKTARPKCTESM